MLQIIFKQGLSRYTPHLHHHSHLSRLSSTGIRKDKYSHTSSSHTPPRKGFGQKSHSPYSTGYGSNSRWEYTGSHGYSKAMGKVVGALGAVTLLGLGTVLGKSQEEQKPCDNETTHPIIERFEKNEEDKVGKDVVVTERKHKYREAIVNSHEEKVRKARQILRRYAEEVGAPGIVVGVTVNGKQVWADGFGFADLENGVRCSPATVMRIASISKSLTMTTVAKLWEDGKLDLDAPIQKYIPSFPKKTYNGEEVTITTRHLLSHQSGIRHYKLKDPQMKESKKKRCDQSNDDSKATTNKGSKGVNVLNKSDQAPLRKESLEEKEKEKCVITSSSENENVPSSNDTKQEGSRNETTKCSCSNHVHRRRKSKKKKKKEEDEFDLEEYYIKEEYETIEDALKLFQNDELFFKPGEGYLYTTHGWTVVSAVVEAAAQQPFTKVVRDLFYELGLNNTYLDVASPIIYNRASYYVRDEHGKLKNAPYVDNSYKWAGGGFLSTVGDLCRFGNVMLCASQQEYKKDEGDTLKLPGYLKASTIRQLWTPVNGTLKNWVDKSYGMGWGVGEDRHLYQFCRASRHHAYHTGGAVGASSILLVLPKKEPISDVPEGVVVALLTNMQGVGMYKVALEIAELFEKDQ